jgi:hypothetical protein
MISAILNAWPLSDELRGRMERKPSPGRISFCSLLVSKPSNLQRDRIASIKMHRRPAPGFALALKSVKIDVS